MAVAFENIKDLNNTYQVAPLTVYGTMTRRPFAKMELAAERWEQFLEDDAAADDVLFSTAHKAFVLQAKAELTDMALTDVTIGEGDIALCHPPQGIADTPGHIPAYLHAYNATGNHHVQVTLNALFPASPGIVLSFVRAQMLPPDQTDDVVYTLTFGGGWTLQWGLTREVKVYDPDGWLACKRRITLNEAASFYGNAHLLWEVHNVGGCLYLECSALDEPLIIRDYKDPAYRDNADVLSRTVGTLPAAQVAWAATGGVHAVLIDYFRYPTTGYVETDWIEHMGLYTDDPTVFVYPTPPTGTAVTVEPIATNGSKRRYRVTLTGDGMHTPFVQAWQVYYPAEYAAPSGEWLDLTPFVQSASENLPEDVGSRSTELTLVNWDGDLLGMSGQMAFRYALGYTLQDDTVSQSPRLCGLLKVHRYTHSTGERTYRATGDDRAALLAETELLNPPCLTGMGVDTAIALLATWGGVAPWDITIETGSYTTLNLPKYGFDNPPWLIKSGQKCWTVVKELCASYRVKAEFWPDGKLHIFPDEDPSVISAAYATGVGTTREAAPSSVEMVSDLTNLVNCIFVEGRGEDGKPLYAVVYDSDSIYNPASPRYVGTALMHLRSDPNLSSQDEVNYACYTAYKKRKTGGRTATLRGPLIGYDRWPGELVSLVAPMAGLDDETLFRITSITVAPKDRFNGGTITLEEVLDL